MLKMPRPVSLARQSQETGQGASNRNCITRSKLGLGTEMEFKQSKEMQRPSQASNGWRA